jgi:hypothetical protein
MTGRLISSAVLTAILFADTMQAHDPFKVDFPALKSGPQVGARNNRRGFFPQHVTGPAAGKHVCPVWSEFDLVALIFARETSDSLTSLVKKIDQRMAAAAGKTPNRLGAFVLFANNSNGLDQKLRVMAATEDLKSVSLSIGGPPGNPYELNNEADVTVVIYSIGRRSQQNVRANFALRGWELDDAKVDAIVRALSDVLPK